MYIYIFHFHKICNFLNLHFIVTFFWLITSLIFEKHSITAGSSNKVSSVKKLLFWITSSLIIYLYAQLNETLIKEALKETAKQKKRSSLENSMYNNNNCKKLKQISSVRVMGNTLGNRTGLHQYVSDASFCWSRQLMGGSWNSFGYYSRHY